MNRYVHQDTGDDARDGLSPETAWQSLENSVGRLVAGSTLIVARASTPYTDRIFTTQHGEENKPISIITPDQAIIGGYGWQLDHDWWDIGGFHAEAFTGVMLVIGRDRVAHHVNVDNWNFFHARKPGVWFYHVKDTIATNCHFRNLRSGELYKDRNALLFKRTADRVLISDCRFEDIGSDGIHVLPNGYYGFCGNIRIEDCRFWVNRPYGIKLWQNIYNNMGENGVDVKSCDGPVCIRRCHFAGFQEILEPQDSSSDHGCGTAIQIHYNARKVYIWDVHVEGGVDAPGRRGIRVNPHVTPSVGPVYIGKFTTHNVTEPISIQPGWEYMVHEIYEDPLPDNGNGGNEMSIITDLEAMEAELRSAAQADITRADRVAQIIVALQAQDAAADELAVQAQALADSIEGQ